MERKIGNIERLKEIQTLIGKSVILEDRFTQIKTVCGMDVHFFKKNHREFGVGCAVVMSLPELKLLEAKFFIKEVDFPYIPTFLAFRELRIIWNTYRKIHTAPDLILIDGQGIAHPRRCGIATHFGVIASRPTIGCAKSYLFGEYKKIPDHPDSAEPLFHQNEHIGWVYRSLSSRRPLFISPGHLISVKSSLKLTKNMCIKRVPEPLRVAHQKLREVI